MSGWRKLWGGPARVVRCVTCGRPASVPWGRSILVSAFVWGPLLAVNAAQFATPDPLPPWVHTAAVATILVGAVLMFPLYVKFVPLVRR